MTGPRTGIYPGTFDPVTLGHADIIRRASKLVDRLIVGVTTNPSKQPLFSAAERQDMVRREVGALGLGNVEVQGFDALLVKFARRMNAGILIRGLRAVADFEYEYQMAGMNQQIDHSIETVFLMADVSLQPIASKLVKEIALFGGDIAPFVSPQVAADLIARVQSVGLRGEY
ncbi:pantetheine-phosphate adenylyltransferase [Erythrobacteraceae bacterium CFH 75059]|uniref:pantetheine-phosphate adenylyltransferase n=1 Tax=Qipengyuania thermophila TaxID=2509361 RepID=UPI00101FE5FF|nr:pantetheine-phosphate adenylyltransferase [Qipengyuania thermophila]TCD05113.1 pantetheine-phosphate adenylyltransferase [Erythrobacteraceae bacterium CFH 75059]